MKSKYFNAAAIFLCGMLPIWIFFVTPAFHRLPNNFSYQAELLSLDNFFNEAEQKYAGETRSISNFSYESLESKDGIAVIKNRFDVRTVLGEAIFSVEREYGIDQNTHQHVAGFGDKERQGYLFSPRHLTPKDSFTYWHVNYDGPAQMSFAGEEYISNLKVYRFESNYEGVTIDQTANLTHLPGVGITRGVILEPHLEIWIEPRSGYLVKYMDETVASFYDLETGERLSPWNHFSNTYTRKSIENHVELAKSEKLKLICVETLIPSAMVMVAIAIGFLGYRRKTEAFFALTLLFVGTTFTLFQNIGTTVSEKPLKVGIARWVDNIEHEKNIEGFKAALKAAGFEEGKQIEYIEPAPSEAVAEKHENTIKGFIDQEVDLIYSLTTPGTEIAKKLTSEIPIVFSIVTYPEESGLIQSLTDSGNNLVGTRNWVPVDEQLDSFLEFLPTVKTIGFLRNLSEKNSRFQLSYMEDAAQSRGLEIVEIGVTDRSEIAPALEAQIGNIDSVYLSCDTLVQDEKNQELILEFAQKNRIPNFSCVELAVRKGSLMGLVADFYEIGNLAGQKAILIFEGVPPTSLETTTTANPQLFLNQAAADLLELNFPQSLLIRAKETIHE